MTQIRRFLIVLVLALLGATCQPARKTDLRVLAPAETLVYLETNDLGGTLRSLTQNKSFEELAKNSTDFSSLANIQVAVVVTGFETSEKQVTNESAILNFKPRFALIADTHAWESTAVSLVEDQIGRYVKDHYGDDVKLDTGEKNGLRFFHWTGHDNQKIFARVTGSLIFVGNDETTIDKCLAVKKGEAESFLTNQNFVKAFEDTKHENNLAFGYISTDGIAQLANLAGVSAAIGTSDEDIVRSFVAKNLPILVRKTAREIVWTSQKTELGIVDDLLIKMDSNVSSVWKETLIGFPDPKFESAGFLPGEFNSITRYNLQRPDIAWQSVLMTTSKQLDELSGKILTVVSGGLFTPYGVTDPENFLTSVRSEILTIRFDEEGDETVVIAEVKDVDKLKKSISAAINFKSQSEKLGAAQLWRSEDRSLTAAFIEDKLILGETQSVLKCLQAAESGQTFDVNHHFPQFKSNDSAATTLGDDSGSAEKMVGVLGEPKEYNKRVTGYYITETRFGVEGIARRSVSNFGFIGLIIEKFVADGK